MVFDAEVDDVLGFLDCDAPPLTGIKLVHRETAEIALGIVDIGNGNLYQSPENPSQFPKNHLTMPPTSRYH